MFKNGLNYMPYETDFFQICMRLTLPLSVFLNIKAVSAGTEGVPRNLRVLKRESVPSGKENPASLT